jgi:hypothetical protein
MQVIIAYDGGPEDYAREEAHFDVGRPYHCPNCRREAVLRALGYYSRWVSSMSRHKMTQILVRRFRCSACRLTTSMLPDFAQTYRLVETDTVDQYLAGSRSGPSVDVWAELLGRYQRKFESRLPETRRILSKAFSLPELPHASVDLWDRARRFFGGARRLASRLAGEAGMTIFGSYQCHQPFREVPVHTSVWFHSERAPPSCPPGHDHDPGTSKKL